MKYGGHSPAKSVAFLGRWKPWDEPGADGRTARPGPAFNCVSPHAIFPAFGPGETAAMKSNSGPVYCFGHVSTGIVLQLKMPYPAADGYAEVAHTHENHAGEATGTALVLARLGIPVTLEGNWIGDTPACRRTMEFLRERDIDVSGLVVKADYPGATEVVVSDGQSRTVFGRYCDLLFTTRQWEMPDPERISAARFACVDPSFGEDTMRVARTAASLRIPLATCDAKPESELASLADVMVVSGEFLKREFPDAVEMGPGRSALFERYLGSCRGLVVFTAGREAVWYGRSRNSAPTSGRSNPGTRIEREPFLVDVVDSAGAGDSFRGGLVYGLLQGWSDEDCVRFACAVAALICTTVPGCVHAPTLEEISDFLAARGEALPA